MTTMHPQALEPCRIGLVSVSDRASSGVYEDKGLPALREWLTRAVRNPLTFDERLIPDEQDGISAALIALVDAGCHLVLTTGGTGPALRDVTPEATLAVAHKEMPGFGEQMRQISLRFVPTAILSRQVAVVREQSPITFEPRLIPDEQDTISATLIDLVNEGCSLVLTTGGTGPALRDVTPEATLAVAHKELPGFGEQMRQISLRFVPTAILSRQTAVVRGQCLIINLPGQPKAIQETLEGLKGSQGEALVPGIFAAVPYCMDLIGGPYLESVDSVCAAFRPKSARRPPAG